jgi:3-phenylpropionate/cinnamic acid dioxygenase small subunit
VVGINEGLSGNLQLRAEVQDFLYYEAKLLDEGEFDRWLELFTEDVEYVVTSATLSGGGDTIKLFDDDKTTLTLRVQRLRTNFAWAEDPPSKTVRVVSNVLTEIGQGVIKVYSNLVIYKAREGVDVERVIARRKDELVREGGRLRIRRREAQVIPPTLDARNLSVLI